MSVLVGCEVCGKLAIVGKVGTRCACGGERYLILTSEQNEERWRRGVTPEQWVHAPRAPKRSECEGGPRPCPYVRCRYYQRGPVPCAADVANEGPRTLPEIGAALDINEDTAGLEVIHALEHARELHGVSSRRELVALLRNLAAANENKGRPRRWNSDLRRWEYDGDAA